MRTKVSRALPILLAAVATVGVIGLTACVSETVSTSEERSRADRQGSFTADQKPQAIGQDSHADASDSAGAEAAPGPAGTRCADGTMPRTMRLSTGSQGPHDTRTWAGRIVEPHGATYQVVANVDDDGCTASGTFEYVGLGCSGTWTIESAEEISQGSTGPNAVRIYFRETVTSDPQRACAETAEVSLTMGPGGMFYASSWDRSDGEATNSRTHLEPVQ